MIRQQDSQLNKVADGRPMCVKGYNYENGRLRASIRWLITRIYNGDNQLPDNLREPFRQTRDGNLELTIPVIACLTNGFFYCQAASRIFKDNSILTNNIGSVFHALAQAGIDIRDQDGACITEEILTKQLPFNRNAHLLFIDALMIAHLRSIISIEKVVQVIGNYTSIAKGEEPLDWADALLFWINKVCLLVRDDVERNGIPLNGGGNTETTIPEMEDLYEDLCDGTCICALVSFYRPNELSLQEICFKDPMSVNDCKFNLELLKKFCTTCLPWNPFHFEIDDILFLHESLQHNVNAFLADLFHFFEGQPQTEPANSAAQQQPVQRRFAPIQPIPDLRSAHRAAGVAGKLANTRIGLEKRDRAQSMASEDSMMTVTTLKSHDSLNFAASRHPRIDPNMPVTHFGAIPANSSKDVTSVLNAHQNQHQSAKSLTEIRLQMEEMRRQLERRHQLESVKQEQAINAASKDAFFRVMSRSANANTQQNNVPTDLTRAANEPGETDQQMQQFTHQFDNQMNLNAMTTSGTNSHYDQPQQLMRTPNGQLTRGIVAGNYFPQQQQTSTPQNMMVAQQQYATPHQKFSPIGPPPSNSVFYGNDSFHNTSNEQQQMFQLQPQNAAQSMPQIQGQFFPQYQQQNYTPIPTSVAPAFHHQLAMGANQQQFFGNPDNMYATGANVNLNGQPYLNMGRATGPYNQNGMDIQMQPSFSQPSHLNLLHQPQYGVQQNQQQQQFFQSPSNFDQQHRQPHNQQQQQYATIPPLPFGSTTTVFPSTETLVMPSHQSHSQQQNLVEESRPSPFRLHQSNAPASRLDPQLELNNKHLTNWEVASRTAERPQRKTWAQKQAENNANNQSSPANITGSSGSDQLETIVMPSNVISNLTTNSTPEKEKIDHQQLLGQMARSTYDDAFNGGNSSARGGGLVLEDAVDPNSEMTPEMQARRRALLANQMKRKERIGAKSEEKEMESLERRQSEMAKFEQAELRKLEREQRRQKLLEDYKRKKMEQELGEPSSARTYTTSTISLNRGHSQPPFGRPKSQSNLHLNQARTLQRPDRTQSNMMNNDENLTPRVSVPSIAEPSLKLFAKQQPKSNRMLIMNALQYSVFPGHVTNENRQKAQAAIASSDSKHFLVLFRDHKCQYRGLYTWDQFSDTVHKIEGTGPKVCKESMMTIMYKYDSGGKSFGQIQTKHLSATIDGFVIADQYWQKPKIPHSGR